MSGQGLDEKGDERNEAGDTDAYDHGKIS